MTREQNDKEEQEEAFLQGAAVAGTDDSDQ